MTPKLLALTLATLVLTACATPEAAPPASLPNPASAHCLKVGGQLEIRRDDQGAESGYCHLPSGHVVEEWALLRGEDPLA